MGDGPSQLTHDAWRRHLAYDWGEASLADLARGSLSEAFAQGASAAGDQPALTIDGATVSHADLDSAAARIGGWLHDRGIRPGSRVLLAGATSHAFVRAYLGVLRSGATAMPVESGLTTPEFQRVLSVASPDAAFVSKDAANKLAAASAAPGLLVGLEPGVGAADLADANGGQPIEPAGPGSAAILAFTSGTSGEPKGVPLSHGNLLSSMRAAMLAWRWSPDDLMLHSLPLSHQHGLGGLHATLMAGSRAVIEPRFDAQRFVELAHEAKATVMLAVPAMYERLLDLPAEKLCLPSLRLAVSGSARLPASHAERIGERMGQIPLERYGSTEAGLVLSNLYEGPRLPGRVGYPLPGIQIRLVDPGGADVEPGSPGEILVRGPQLFSGYWKRPEATAEVLDTNGWFRSGDIGVMDPADYSIEVTGRSKELIITGGLNVSPAEVEEFLNEHELVRQAAVAGIPSERWGEEVVAFVVPVASKSPKPDELISHCRERLSAYKCPKRVVLVDEIPSNSMGKVLRDQLVPIAIDNDTAEHPSRAHPHA